MATEDTSSSTSAFVTSLIIYGIIALIFIWLFLTLRPRNRRTYEPRTLTDIQTIKEEERTDEVPSGYFQWVPFLLGKPHSFLIQHTSLDGYLFLRYIGIFATTSLLLCFILFPILLPVNATNGNNLKGFELLSFANVTNKNRFFAHVFLSWIVFGLITYIIYKELYYYIILRQAVQTSPLYDGLLSSRTVMITELDPSIAQEGELEKRFSKAVNINFAHDLSHLEKHINERRKVSMKLESSLNKVIDKAVKRYYKYNEKKPEKLFGPDNNKPQANLETYVPYYSRPSHRINTRFPFFPFGEKVDTIHHCTEELAQLNDKVHTQQRKWDKNEKLPAAFIQFDTQLEAQECFQSIEGLLGPKSFGRKLINSVPEDINWSNMKLSSAERKSKRILANSLMVALIIFWAIPVAVVGCISNINFLTEKVPFLKFINNLPNFLMGLITGILPTLMLAVLMSLLPPFIKMAGTLSGCLTKLETDQYCQKWYYAFQVIQVFIVTTLASSASATVEAIIRDPSSAMTLLANNLPKASNFYIAYFLLQGLTVPSGSLLQALNLVLQNTMGRILDSTPRQKWKRYNTLSKPDMGVIYPTMEILVCIYISYSIIAPLLLVFSTIALFLMYIAYLYNLNFVLGFSPDFRGRNYPRALFQVFVGIYLSEVCLVGLFIMAKTWGPLVLECFWIVVTALAHIYMKRKFLPLIDAVPLSVIHYARGEPNYHYPSEDLGLKEVQDIGKVAKEKVDAGEFTGVIRPATHADLKRANLLRDDDQEESSSTKSSTSSDPNATMKNYNPSEYTSGSSSKKMSVGGNDTLKLQNTSTFVEDEEGKFRKYHYDDVKGLKDLNRGNNDRSAPDGVLAVADYGNMYGDVGAVKNAPEAFPPNITEDVSFFGRIRNFFNPKNSYPFEKVRTRLPHVYNTTVEYDQEYLTSAYTDPIVNEKDPIIWICKDPMGVSKQQIEEAEDSGAKISHDFAEYNEKGKSTFTFNPPDYEPPVKK
ncbi:Phm7p NDAI_0B02790 [Naumovozyma dairenensis CBS 421]|uniref:Uncharacterized protein n=1 Tax=Naumovozyma dairenensis (strain ATCC 10597 / BCRC 20456 / CBS 421 / NBRC 0211 / NRRL Y-12639) TaxID=1071378 RepID=G0W6A3_NAUDC|nr:hypothetical protein NDAI_0B02790 [Naumovozyma dairenensis CBS 421]CCD23314.1 hypothetical protein NDAI_0B02790 [Naumovozyma dairenensis CBS 421]